jgi:hypothetical protein
MGSMARMTQLDRRVDRHAARTRSSRLLGTVTAAVSIGGDAVLVTLLAVRAVRAFHAGTDCRARRDPDRRASRLRRGQARSEAGPPRPPPPPSCHAAPQWPGLSERAHLLRVLRGDGACWAFLRRSPIRRRSSCCPFASSPGRPQSERPHRRGAAWYGRWGRRAGAGSAPARASLSGRRSRASIRDDSPSAHGYSVIVHGRIAEP